MRISDWSSDVCSSDLGVAGNLPSLEALEALLTDTGLTWSTTPAGAILLHDLVKPTDKGRNAAGHARPDEQWQEAQIIDDLHRCKSGIAQVRVLATHPSYILEKDRKSTRLNSRH